MIQVFSGYFWVRDLDKFRDFCRDNGLSVDIDSHERVCFYGLLPGYLTTILFPKQKGTEVNFNTVLITFIDEEEYVEAEKGESIVTWFEVDLETLTCFKNVIHKELGYVEKEIYLE